MAAIRCSVPAVPFLAQPATDFGSCVTLSKNREPVGAIFAFMNMGAFLPS